MQNRIGQQQEQTTSFGMLLAWTAVAAIALAIPVLTLTQVGRSR